MAAKIPPGAGAAGGAAMVDCRGTVEAPGMALRLRRRMIRSGFGYRLERDSPVRMGSGAGPLPFVRCREARYAMTAVLLALLLLAAGDARGDVRSYTVDGSHSRVTIAVGRSGLFRFAGHTHEVLAPSMTGEVALDLEGPGGSEVQLSFETAALQVTGRGDPPADVPKVQAVMVGPRVLDADRFPRITFRSESVSGRIPLKGAGEIEVTGDLSLHGVTKRLTLPMQVRLEGDSLTVAGTAVLRQTDFDIQPVSVAGVVKVKNEITITYRIVSRLR
jgi:polyisoprenoid-binding protein YceI